uniref:Lipase n=1 Tax=Leersia perrieri TaxID=77586 RepID=A0A0D9XA32_9ORYZ
MSTPVIAAAVLVLSLQLAAASRVLNHGGAAPDANIAAAGGACATAVSPFGYACEEHEVTTPDGYILGMQRIPRGRRVTGGGGGRQPVILQHGVLVDGMTWLLGSPEESLPYILADQGFDVWIANNRGTRWSRRHVSLDPSSRSYWNWSWDDLVVNDMPAIVDYVCSHSGQKPHYVGHSMGTLVALAAFSEGRLVDKLKSAALLSPVAYLSHITTPIGIVIAKAFAGELISDFLGIAEFNPASPQVSNLVRTFCRKPGVNCYDLLTSFTGKNYCLNNSAAEIFLKYEPQPTSTKTLVHLAQTVRDGVLTKYDYVRPDMNVAKYGQADPPAYDMSAIPARFPLFLSYGGRDSLSDPADVELLLDDLRRGHDGDKLTVQYLPQLAHADFVIGVCAKDLVYNDVVSFFHRFH